MLHRAIERVQAAPRNKVTRLTQLSNYSQNLLVLTTASRVLGLREKGHATIAFGAKFLRR